MELVGFGDETLFARHDLPILHSFCSSCKDCIKICELKMLNCLYLI
jgi:hypothetical protein